MINLVQKVSSKTKLLKFKLLVNFFLPGQEKILGLIKLYPEEIQKYLFVCLVTRTKSMQKSNN